MRPQHATHAVGLSGPTQDISPSFSGEAASNPFLPTTTSSWGSSNHSLPTSGKKQSSTDSHPCRKLPEKRNYWGINCASTENSISWILLYCPSDVICTRKACTDIWILKSTTQESTQTRPSFFMLSILMVFQDLSLKGNGKIHFVALNSQS